MKKFKTVSLIDDDEIYQLLTGKMIENTGLVEDLLSFGDGQEALDYLLTHQQDADRLPDMILLDLEMPFMDGWQFLEQYSNLKFPKEIVLFINSSSTSLADQERSRQFPQVRGYLIKPLTREQFEALLHSF
jgi:two-component system, chemotaxis family, chemotaxis protein CheY